MTRILVTTSSEQADAAAGIFQGPPDNYTVIPIGPTEGVEVAGVEDANVLWQSEGAGPFYVVVVTQDAAGD